MFFFPVAEPRTRPKLNLAPRTKPLETPAAGPEPSSPTASAPPAAPAPSIFGAAKPVDTSARERQIEERLAKKSEKPARDSSLEGRREGGRRYVSIAGTFSAVGPLTEHVGVV